MIAFKKVQQNKRDDYVNGCLLNYNYFHEYYKMIAIDLINQ